MEVNGRVRGSHTKRYQVQAGTTTGLPSHAFLAVHRAWCLERLYLHSHKTDKSHNTLVTLDECIGRYHRIFQNIPGVVKSSMSPHHVAAACSPDSTCVHTGSGTRTSTTKTMSYYNIPNAHLMLYVWSRKIVSSQAHHPYETCKNTAGRDAREAQSSERLGHSMGSHL